jgi:colicin import membrane protein
MELQARNRAVAVTFSVTMHALIIAVLLVGMPFASERQYVPPASQMLAIEATVVDGATIQRELARIEQRERDEQARVAAEQQRQRDLAEQARRERVAEEQRLEQARRDRETAERAEQERVQQLAIERERAERELADQRQRAEEEARRRAEQEAQRAEEERLARLRAEEEERQRQQEAERRRQEEAERQRREAELARQRAESEAELQRMLASEDERRRAQESGLQDQYIALLQAHIERNWSPPGSARAGLECIVHVAQIPSGDVVDVRVGRCNGDDAVVRSIEAAVYRASPLPRPPTQALFSRNIEFVFRPVL